MPRHIRQIACFRRHARIGKKCSIDFQTIRPFQRRCSASAARICGSANIKRRAIISSRVADQFPTTKDGREGLAFAAASNVRLGNNVEAAKLYEKYISLYPDGERIESAFLNHIDALREAGKYYDANRLGKPKHAATIFRQTGRDKRGSRPLLRMQIYPAEMERRDRDRRSAAKSKRFAGSMTSADEVRYLKAFSLEKSGRKAESCELSIHRSRRRSRSYYSGLATEKINPERFDPQDSFGDAK